MGPEDFTTSLILTKLHRPQLPVGMVKRPRLTKWLDQRKGRPLTLVSAPAGYGKSTLISCWLEEVDWPNAWVSLDENDNELGSFLGYFLAAIQTIFPKAMPETRALLLAAPLPPVPVIAKGLINELNQIEEHFLLVLDDYYLIKTGTIHELLSELLSHPPHYLHLVLGTRMDPPLPLVTLRAKSQLTEVRVPSLRFTQEETRLLFQWMVETPIDPADLVEIENQTEGWVTGLRLAALAMRHRIGRENLQSTLSVDNRYVTEYLLTEILAKQAANLSDCLLKTSILERFCAGLCEAVCFQSDAHSDDETEGLKLNGARFLKWLQGSNLFAVPLDGQGEWFRYHHLFRDFLQQELARRFSPDEIRELHAAAGYWLAQNGWIEEALYHLLLANDIPAAIDLVAQHRFDMLNSTQWPRLERWLSSFSTEVIEGSTELWMLKTWLAYHSGQWSELPALLQHMASILASDPNHETAGRLTGEISSLRSLIAYFSGNTQEAIAQARIALEQLPPELWIVRVMARMYLGGSLQMSGDEHGAYHTLYDGFKEEKVQSKRFKASLLMTACNIHWVAADLQSMAQAAKECITLCQEIDFREILGYGNYQLGRVHYQWNNLPGAEGLFASVVVRPYQNYGISYTNSVCGLALTCQALKRDDDARDVIEQAIAFLLETGNITQLPLVLAAQAEVALMQGRLSAASQWAAKLNPVPPIAPMPWFLAPHLTLIKVWLAQDTPESRVKADELSSQLVAYLAGTHNTRFLIEALALRALLENATGDQTAALAALEKALRMAQAGGFMRIFVDLGAQMEVLLSQVRATGELGAYVTRIRAAFPGLTKTGFSISQERLLEPLTGRELEILELLGDRLTNKEIAAQLVISPGTVKGYTIRIYHKLDVNDRRQAVAKATELGILSPR